VAKSIGAVCLSSANHGRGSFFEKTRTTTGNQLLTTSTRCDFCKKIWINAQIFLSCGTFWNQGGCTTVFLKRQGLPFFLHFSILQRFLLTYSLKQVIF